MRQEAVREGFLGGCVFVGQARRHGVVFAPEPPIMLPPLFGLPPEVLEVEQPTADATTSAPKQIAKTSINICRRMAAPFACEYLPTRGSREPAQVQHC